MVNAVNLSAFSILQDSVHDALDEFYSVTWRRQRLFFAKKNLSAFFEAKPFRYW